MLDVVVEPQTPQRLHVKIGPVDGGISSSGSGSSGSDSSGTQSTGTSDSSDAQDRTVAGSPRWEVPTWLIPR